MKKRFGSRGKGSTAELEVAKLLEAWWRGLEPECKFARTPLSGGWGAPALRAGFRVSGDLTTTATSFRFTVEVKRREGWSWDRLRAGRPSPVWAWWRQAQVQALEMGAEPLMFFRHNREDWFVMVRSGLEVNDGGLLFDRLEAHARWTEEDLRGVDYGAELAHPVIYAAADILGLEPSLLAIPF